MARFDVDTARDGTLLVANMSADLTRTAETLRAFVKRRYLPNRQRNLADDEPLISSGIIDSMGLVDLTNFIEEEFGIFLGPDEFGKDRADTLTQVTALMAKRR